MGTLNKTQSSNSKPWDGGRKFFIMENIVDLTGVATGDVVQALAVPALTKVLDVIVKIATPTGLTSSATVGDGNNASGFKGTTVTNLNAAAGSVTNAVGGTDAYATQGGVLYTVDDTIDLTCTVTGGPCTAGKVEVYALCADLR